MTEKTRVPKKGAGRRLAEKLRDLGNQLPPPDLVNKINQEDKKKIASPRSIRSDLEAK
jgi:hypothetical protein